MGALGWALKLTPEQEKKFLMNIQKFAEDMDPDQIKEQILGYARKVDSLHDATSKMYDLVGTMAVYTKQKDPEGWSKAKAEYERMKKEALEKSSSAKKAWKGGQW